MLIWLRKYVKAFRSILDNQWSVKVRSRCLVILCRVPQCRRSRRFPQVLTRFGWLRALSWTRSPHNSQVHVSFDRPRLQVITTRWCIKGTSKGAITSKIKHAIKLKTSPARLAQLLQPSLAFRFSLQPMTAHRSVCRRWLQAKTKC